MCEIFLPSVIKKTKSPSFKSDSLIFSASSLSDFVVEEIVLLKTFAYKVETNAEQSMPFLSFPPNTYLTPYHSSIKR